MQSCNNSACKAACSNRKHIVILLTQRYLFRCELPLAMPSLQLLWDWSEIFIKNCGGIFRSGLWLSGTRWNVALNISNFGQKDNCSEIYIPSLHDVPDSKGAGEATQHLNQTIQTIRAFRTCKVYLYLMFYFRDIFKALTALSISDNFSVIAEKESRQSNVDQFLRSEEGSNLFGNI